MRSRAILILLPLALAACGDDKEIDPPAELVDIDHPTLGIKRLWSEGLGGDAERLRLGLRPEVVAGVVYAASHEGDVVALTADTGRRVWRARTDLPLSAGPGVGGDLVVAGSSDGDVVGLELETGEQRWHINVSSEVLSRPLVANGTVVVRTVDGRLTALSSQDGSQQWQLEENVPRLTLRGTAPPVRAGDLVISGFDNGKVVAVELATGDVVWNASVSAPRGRTELERLVDLDSPIRVVDDDVFVVGFQGRIALLALGTGQIWWGRDLSSYRGFALDAENLYVTDAQGVVMAIRRRDGAEVWQQPALLRRGVTAPAIDGDALVVGDFEGYLHWLDRGTGALLARAKTDGERITNAPVAAEGHLYVFTDAGRLLALESAPRG